MLSHWFSYYIKKDVEKLFFSTHPNVTQIYRRSPFFILWLMQRREWRFFHHYLYSRDHQFHIATLFYHHYILYDRIFLILFVCCVCVCVEKCDFGPWIRMSLKKILFFIIITITKTFFLLRIKWWSSCSSSL